MDCITVAGWATCPFHQQAVEASKAMVASGQARLADEKTFATRDEFVSWLASEGSYVAKGDPKAASHNSSPFVWCHDGKGRTSFVGGCDDMIALSQKSGLGQEAARSENRLISLNEAKIRQSVGLAILAAVIAVTVLFPSTRMAYGPLSLGWAVAGGVFMTGKQSL